MGEVEFTGYSDFFRIKYNFYFKLSILLIHKTCKNGWAIFVYNI